MSSQETFGIGNPEKYKPDDINKVNKKTFKKLYLELANKLFDLEKNGFEICCLWEKDWLSFCKKNNIKAKVFKERKKIMSDDIKILISLANGNNKDPNILETVKNVRFDTFNTNLTIKEMAEKYNILHGKCGKIIFNKIWFDPEYIPPNKDKYVSRHREEWLKKYARVIPETDQELIKEYLQKGLTQKTIGVKYNITAGAVAGYIKKYNLAKYSSGLRCRQKI